MSEGRNLFVLSGENLTFDLVSLTALDHSSSLLTPSPNEKRSHEEQGNIPNVKLDRFSSVWSLFTQPITSLWVGDFCRIWTFTPLAAYDTVGVIIPPFYCGFPLSLHRKYHSRNLTDCVVSKIIRISPVRMRPSFNLSSNCWPIITFLLLLNIFQFARWLEQIDTIAFGPARLNVLNKRLLIIVELHLNQLLFRTINISTCLCFHCCVCFWGSHIFGRGKLHLIRPIQPEIAVTVAVEHKVWRQLDQSSLARPYGIFLLGKVGGVGGSEIEAEVEVPDEKFLNF